ncbi:MAG: helix-turn-helix transcriptional regulator [Bacillota bacterium]|jgi:transcriptional regulator with XRE-family HTH domain
MEIFKKVKELCVSKGISISELEKEVGFSKSAIYRWNENIPSGDKLLKVAEYFNVTTDYLLGKKPPPPEHKFSDVSLDQRTLEIMFQITRLSETNKTIISELIQSMIRNQE